MCQLWDGLGEANGAVPGGARESGRVVDVLGRLCGARGFTRFCASNRASIFRIKGVITLDSSVFTFHTFSVGNSRVNIITCSIGGVSRVRARAGCVGGVGGLYSQSSCTSVSGSVSSSHVVRSLLRATLNEGRVISIGLLRGSSCGVVNFPRDINSSKYGFGVVSRCKFRSNFTCTGVDSVSRLTFVARGREHCLEL